MRALCPHCFRPPKTCFCDLIVQCESAVETVIWQHPSEQEHPKGTAKILHHCLPNSRLVIGEVLSPAQLGLCLEPHSLATMAEQRVPVLLYPEDNNSTPFCSSSHLKDTDSLPLSLVVIDGTWRKSRKIMHLNPWLNTLPRLGLRSSAGAYTIRKAEAAHQLSTFESVVAALGELESETSFEPLEKVFQNYIARLEAFRPK